MSLHQVHCSCYLLKELPVQRRGDKSFLLKSSLCLNNLDIYRQNSNLGIEIDFSSLSFIFVCSKENQFSYVLAKNLRKSESKDTNFILTGLIMYILTKRFFLLSFGTITLEIMMMFTLQSNLASTGVVMKDTPYLHHRVKQDSQFCDQGTRLHQRQNHVLLKTETS